MKVFSWVWKARPSCLRLFWGCTRAAAARGRGEAPGAEGVEDVEHERVVLGREVEHPEDVDHSEDEPACRHRIERRKARENALVDTKDGEDDCNRTECRDLESVHGYRVCRESMEDAEDEEQLDKDGEP